MLQEKQIEILMRMHELEKSIGELYSLFTEKFPQCNDLWNKLSREEQGHAEALRKLYQITYDGQSIFEESNIKVEAVQSVIDYVKGIRELAMRGKLSMQKALTITYDLENTLLEKTIFDRFKVTSQYCDIIQTLHRETKNHALMAKEQIDKFCQADKQRKDEKIIP